MALWSMRVLSAAALAVALVGEIGSRVGAEPPQTSPANLQSSDLQQLLDTGLCGGCDLAGSDLSG